MQNFKTIITTLSVIFIMVACLPKPHPRRVVDRLTKIDDIEYKVGPTNETKFLPIVDDYGMTSGGQPGDIEISGDLVQINKDNDYELIPAIKVHRVAGFGKNGNRAKIAQQLELSPSLSPEFPNSVGKIKAKTFMNVGCDLSGINLSGYTENIFDPNQSLSTPFQVVSAEKVWICDSKELNGIVVIIKAVDIVFDMAQGGNSKIIVNDMSDLVVRSKSLEVIGELTINLTAKDSRFTSFKMGPSLTLETKEYIGSGKINVTSKGSNYKGLSK